jgi:hypothetical protein
MRLLSGRESASRLGIHENTLRKSEERGIVRAVKLPGSGFRRYAQEHIAKLAADMARQLERPIGNDDVAPQDAPMIRGRHDASLWKE